MNKVVEGISHVTVKCGDTTLFMDVKDFTLVIDNDREDGWFSDAPVVYTSSDTYAIKGSIVADELGHFYTVVVKKKPVWRTAEIEVEDFTLPNLEAARVAVGAPEDAHFSTYRDDSPKVNFKWRDNV